jgi:hypothetical protein
MSDTLSQMGHTVHIVTYSTGQEDIVVRHAKVHRTGPFRPETNAKVGPSPEKFLEDLALLRLLLPRGGANASILFTRTIMKAR